MLLITGPQELPQPLTIKTRLGDGDGGRTWVWEMPLSRDTPPSRATDVGAWGLATVISHESASNEGQDKASHGEIGIHTLTPTLIWGVTNPGTCYSLIPQLTGLSRQPCGAPG